MTMTPEEARAQEIAISPIEKQYPKVAAKLRAGMHSSNWPEDRVDPRLVVEAAIQAASAQPAPSAVVKGMIGALQPIVECLETGDWETKDCGGWGDDTKLIIQRGEDDDFDFTLGDLRAVAKFCAILSHSPATTSEGSR